MANKNVTAILKPTYLWVNLPSQGNTLEIELVFNKVLHTYHSFQFEVNHFAHNALLYSMARRHVIALHNQLC
jgi:hypothetical protein